MGSHMGGQGRRTFPNLRTISGFQGGLSPNFCIAPMWVVIPRDGVADPQLHNKYLIDRY